MKSIWFDLRYALRTLRKSPGFASVAILTLALGIGANTAIFTVVYGVLLRPLPFPEPERLVLLVQSVGDESGEAGVDMREFLRLRQYSQLFSYMTGYTMVGYNLATGSGADHLLGMPVSADYFRALGIRPELGRDFVEQDDAGSGQHVAIVSYGLWNRRFAGNGGGVGGKDPLEGGALSPIRGMPQTYSPQGPNGASRPA